MERLIQKEYPALEALYRELHACPELSLKEEKTSARAAQELRRSDFQVTQNVGGFGVVGILENGLGKTVMVRSDSDALPIQEETGLPFASRNQGIMHACGHDFHLTALAGVAKFFSERRDLWRGRLILIAQPAEEKGSGAEAMIQDGLFKRFPKPDWALALHVDSQLPAGKIGYASGFAFANVDSVDLTVKGRGSHGAYPHLGVDPIVIASEIVLALQTIVSRELKPYEPAVVTCGSIHGGTKHNIIPDEVKLEMTVRSYGDETRAQILEAIKRISTETARAHKAPHDPEIKISESIPATYNDPDLVRRLVPVLKNALGDSNVVQKDPELGGEDFGLYSRAGVPSLMFRVGSVPEKKFAESRKPGGPPLPSLHSSRYAPDFKPTLSTALKAMTALVLELLRPGK